MDAYSIGPHTVSSAQRLQEALPASNPADIFDLGALRTIFARI